MDKLKKFEDILKLLDESLTREEFTTSFENVVKLVKRLEENNVRDFIEIKKTIDIIKKQLKDDSSMTNSEIKELVKKESQRISDNFKNLSDRLNDAILEIKDGEDGKDADEELIIERVVESIKIPTIEELKDDLPKMGTQVRDALELLQGEDRLDASAIKGLEDLISKYKTEVKVGGGFNSVAMNFHFADPYTPAGDVNGINKEFILSDIPSPSTSLVVWKDGQKQRLSVDYTLSGVTITFTEAPLSDTIIEVSYRI